MKEQSKVIILGNTKVKLYKFRTSSLWTYSTIDVYYKTLDNPVVWEGYLDNPLMKIGDEIFVNDLKSTFKITRVVKSTSNSLVYYIDYNVGEIIENEETEKSLLEAEKEKADCDNKKELENLRLQSEYRAKLKLEIENKKLVNRFKKLFKK